MTQDEMSPPDEPITPNALKQTLNSTSEESWRVQLDDIEYFVVDDDTSERSVPRKHRPEFAETRIGLTIGVHYGADPLTAWFTLDPHGSPVVVLTDANGCLVSDGETRTSDQHVDVAAVTAFVVATWQRLRAGEEVRSLPKSLNGLWRLMEVRAAALGTSVEGYIRDLVLAEARVASPRDHACAAGSTAKPPTHSTTGVANHQHDATGVPRGPS